MLELSAEELAYIVDLIRADHKEILHELHHTDTREFEERLKRRLEVNEAVARKLGVSAA